MTQEQFFQVIRSPQNRPDISNQELAQLVEQFPFSQPLRYIYLRQLKDQNSVHYGQQLKLTAIYSPDRSVLFNYVNEEPVNSIEPIADPTSIQENESKSEPDHTPYFTAMEPSVSEEFKVLPPVSLAEEDFFSEEAKNETEMVSQTQEVMVEEPKNNDNSDFSPQDIIDQRLRELKITNETISPLPFLPEVESEEPMVAIVEDENENESTEQVTTEIGKQEESSNVEIDTVLPLNQNTATNDLLNELVLVNLAESQFYKTELLLPDNEIIAQSIESKLNQSLTTEYITPIIEGDYLQNMDVDTSKPHSFTEWLMIAKKIPDSSQKLITKQDEPGKITLSQERKKTSPADNLIEKFILDEPRITPSRSTFYSPVNMARKSVKEDEELVSETLANIYSSQGNFIKAIAAYEKLLMKYPEKKTYFAALINNLKEKLNS